MLANLVQHVLGFLQLPPPTSECSCTSTQRSCTHTARTRYPLYLCWFPSNWSSSLGVHQITCTVSVVDDWSGHQRHIHPEDDVMTVNWLLINCCGPNTQERTPTWLWEHGVENTLVHTAPSMNRKCLFNDVYGTHWYTHYQAWTRNVLYTKRVTEPKLTSVTHPLLHYVTPPEEPRY